MTTYYSQEFKDQIVAQYRQGRTAGELVEEFNCADERGELGAGQQTRGRGCGEEGEVGRGEEGTARDPEARSRAWSGSWPKRSRT